MKLMKALLELLTIIEEVDTVNAEELIDELHQQAEIVSLLAGE